MKIWFVIISLLWAGCQGKLTATRVISADTIELSDGKRVRYAGVDAPSETSNWQERARQANAYLIEGLPVKLIDEPRFSSDQESVAYVYTPILVKGEEKYLFVNAELARFGFVKVRPVDPESRHRELWEILWQFQENEARPLKRNIWSQEEK